MELWQALILGLVEGLTEYLPVSSTGHLLIAQRALGIPASEAANAYAIVIQAGAIVAVLGLYRRRVGELLLGLAGKHAAGRQLLIALAVAFVPAAVIGFLFDDAIACCLDPGRSWWRGRWGACCCSASARACASVPASRSSN